ncbi:MAG: MlaD family protein [Gemmatimonadota bacterium]|nr:MlaD family protein [Gemmatimonadota bacterium]
MNSTEPSPSPGLSDREILRAVPPTAKSREFRVGIFVILGIAGFLTFLFLLTDPGTFRGRYTILTHVSDAQGVRNGDPVRLRGINIGRVVGSRLDSAGVLIALEIEGEWRIPAGSRTELSSEGVLGGMVVSVVAGRGERFVEPMEVIPGEAFPGVLESAGGIAGDAGEVLERIRAVLSDSSIAAASEAVSSLRDVLSDLSLLTEGQAEELRTLTGSLRRSARNVEGITGADEWRRTLASAEAALAVLDRTSADLAASVASLNGILGRMDRGEGTLGRLLTDESLYESLTATAESLRELVADVKANPGRYLKIEIF